MKTRTLLLLSVGCGLAILVAGMVLMLQLVGQPAPAAPLGVGSTGQAGDLVVTVQDVSVIDGVMAVAVEWSGPTDPDATAGFVLVAPDAVVRPVAVGDGACGSPAPEPTTCTLSFGVAELAGTARQLVLERGGEKVRWSLAG